jgi:hypothetical protein
MFIYKEKQISIIYQMIKVQLFAGLGNQLFMIFATISYAIDHGIQYSILSEMEKTSNGTTTYWDTILDAFKTNVITNYSSGDNVYNEPSFEYNALPAHLSHNDCVLKGYFQSYRYFEHNYDKIIDIMKLKQKKDVVKTEHHKYFRKKTIALHFRFGDYIFLQNYHCIKPPSYFIDALVSLSNDLISMKENIEDYDILYFCEPGNDKYVNEFLKIIRCTVRKPLSFIKVDDDIPDWKQMLIMSCCDHFIITNSTFSWFGAYFSEHQRKIVYRPKTWFGPKNNGKDITDMCPAEWKVINV